MKLQKLAGATSEIWQIFIRDSSSTTGGGLTGLTNASSGLTAYYHRDTDTTATAISLVSMTVGSFTSSGFKEIDATNMPGWYQFCPPNAALASGAKSCGFHLKGVTNMAPLPIEVQLLAVNVDDAVRMGMSSLPNANAGANGGLPLSVDASGRVDVLKINGTSQTARDIGASVLLSAGTGTGQLDFTSGVVKANLAQILGTALTETAGQIAAGFKKFFNIATPAATMDHGVLVDTVTTATTATNLTNAPTNGDLTAAMKTSVTTAATAATPVAASVTGNVGGNVTGSVGSVVGAVGSVTGLTASNLDVAVSTRLASSSYTAPPSAATIAQAVWDVLTSALTTVGSIGKLLADNIDAAISSRSTYAGGDTAGTTTLLSRLTSTRAGLLDNMDAAVSTRSTYAGADTSGTTTLLSRLGSPVGASISADIAAVKAVDDAVKAKTDNLPSDPADASDIAAEFASLQSHGDSSWATATGFATSSALTTTDGKVDAIKSVTDSLVMTAGKLWVLDENGNPLPHTTDISSIETAIGALPAASDNAAAVLAATYEGAETVQDHFRLARAALYGKANGLAGTTVHYRDAADTKDRLTAIVDADGNRASVTADAT